MAVVSVQVAMLVAVVGMLTSVAVAADADLGAHYTA